MAALDYRIFLVKVGYSVVISYIIENKKL